MYKLLYIDDECEHIEDFIEDNSESFDIETVELSNEISVMKEELIELISKNRIDCVVLDFFLKQTRPMLNYTGGSLAIELLNKYEAFPVFLLTAKEEDAFNNDIDPLHIISKEKYYSDGGREYYMKRIDRYISQYKNKIDEVELRLKELLLKPNLTAAEEIEEVELNNFLEKTVVGCSDLPVQKFTRSESDKLDKLITIAERILDEI